jgi:anti-sigma factor RsiW
MTLLRKMKIMLKMMLGGYGCGHTARLLYAFVEGELDPRCRQKLEAHLADCPECLEFVRTYRETIAMTHRHDASFELEMPRRLREKLFQFIDEHPALR